MNAVAAWCLPASGRRPLLPAALIALACVVISAWFSRPMLRMIESARIGSTSGIQFESATNWILCGRYDQTTSFDNANRKLVNLAEIRNPDAYNRSVFNLLERAVGSRYAYCHQEPTAWGIAEMGMTLIDAAALRVNPNVPLRTLAIEFAVVRLALIWLFTLSLLRVGYSLVFAALTTAVAVYLTMLLGGHALYSAYPFILPVTLAGIGAGVFVVDSPDLAWFAAGVAGLALWAAFLGALRTSHYPIGLAVVAAAIAFGRASTWPRRLLLGTLVAVTAFLAFDRAFMAPVRAGGVGASHLVAHPLVLGLAVPPNDLATREGIQWDDAVGAVIALRRDPKVVPLSAAYETVLWSYYRELWRLHRSEMIAIYWNKLRTTRDSVFAWLADTQPGPFWVDKDPRLLSWTATAARWLSAPIGLLGLMVLLAAGGVALGLTVDRAAYWPVIAVAVAGLFGFLEAAIVLGSVALWYNAVLIFATAFAGLWPLELAGRGAQMLARRMQTGAHT